MKKRRDEITGLRGLSACAIAYIFHYTVLFGTMPERFAWQAKAMGFLARYSVYMSEIFFMLSGLLLYWAYQKRIEEGGLTLKKFILPKMKKIYPMMMAAALVTWLLQKYGFFKFGEYVLHADGGDLRNSLLALIVSLLGLQTGWISDNDALAVNGPSWFVSVYFVCYAIYYLFTRYLKKDSQKMFAYFAMMALGIFLMIHPLGLPLLFRTSGRGYFSFFAGVVLGRFMDELEEMGRRNPDEKSDMAAFKKMEEPKEGNTVTWQQVLSCILAAIILVGSLYLAETHDALRDLWFVSLFVWTSLIFLVCQVDFLKKIFSWRPFVFLGEKCMAIFLWNMATDLCLELANRMLDLQINYASLKIWCGHVVLSLLVATAMDFIDRRFRSGLCKKKTI